MTRIERVRRRLERAEGDVDALFSIAGWYAEDVAYLLKVIDRMAKEKPDAR